MKIIIIFGNFVQSETWCEDQSKWILTWIFLEKIETLDRNFFGRSQALLTTRNLVIFEKDQNRWHFFSFLYCQVAVAKVKFKVFPEKSSARRLKISIETLKNEIDVKVLLENDLKIDFAQIIGTCFKLRV